MPRKGDNLPLAGSSVVLGVTGSIAAYKSAELVSRLKRIGAEVYVIMTPSAREFIQPLTFQTLSGNPVFSEMFQVPDRFDPLHVSLAQRADLLVVAPASADFIGRVAAGLADDLLSAVALATPAPILLAPAMNSGMYRNPIVQENIRRLKQRGIKFVGPETGRLACGTEGPGRLAELEVIVAAISSILKK